jgi:hypothetical protein
VTDIDDIVIQRSGMVRLSEVAHWFGLEADTAHARAAEGKLPITAFKGQSRKSPWCVNLDDLAGYLKKQYQKQQGENDAINAA